MAHRAFTSTSWKVGMLNNNRILILGGMYWLCCTEFIHWDIRLVSVSFPVPRRVLIWVCMQELKMLVENPPYWISALLYFDQIVEDVVFFFTGNCITGYTALHWKSSYICSFLYSFVLNYVIDEGVSPLGKTTFQSRLQACKHLGMVCGLQLSIILCFKNCGFSTICNLITFNGA